MMSKIGKFACLARKAKDASGKGYAAQLSELFALRTGAGKIGLQEYYLLGLYDDREFDRAAKERFAGWRVQESYFPLNEWSWTALSNDKVAFHAFMKGQGATVADIHAIFHAGRRRLADCPSISGEAELADFIREKIPYPFFSKPVHSWSGFNAKLVERYDAERDELVLRDGTRETVGAFIRSLASRTGMPRKWAPVMGHVFQEALQPSPAVREICGERVSSVRVVILNRNEPRILSAKWKMAVGNNMIDNTGNGSTGNIVAGIGEDGTIERAYAGRLENEVGWVEEHPDTHVRFIGMTVPEWDRIRDCTLSWARAFPGLRMQAWDVASTSKGVIALEVNPVDNTTVFSNQLVNRQGILVPELMELIRGEAANARHPFRIRRLWTQAPMPG